LDGRTIQNDPSFYSDVVHFHMRTEDEIEPELLAKLEQELLVREKVNFY